MRLYLRFIFCFWADKPFVVETRPDHLLGTTLSLQIKDLLRPIFKGLKPFDGSLGLTYLNVNISFESEKQI